MDDFKNCVLEAFSYLPVEYDFRVVESMEDNVNFSNKLARVAVSREQGQVFVDIGPLSGDYDLDLGEIILCKDPKSNFRYAHPGGSDPNAELRRLAELLREYCADMLRGDFQAGPKVLAFRQTRYDELLGPDNLTRT